MNGDSNSSHIILRRKFATPTRVAQTRMAMKSMQIMLVVMLLVCSVTNECRSLVDAFALRQVTSPFVVNQNQDTRHATTLVQKCRDYDPITRFSPLALSSAAAAASSGGNEQDISLASSASSPNNTGDGGVEAITSSPPTTPSVPKTTMTTTEKSAAASSKKPSLRELRAQGGPFSFNTPVGALNPFAIYYGLVSIFLGIPWFFSCKFCQFLYWISGNRFDPKRRIPVFLSHVWGTCLMHLTRCYPTIKNLKTLQDFYKENRPAMFVANHSSWMDIPFLGVTIGWRNYKLISKKELGAVPILGTSIRAGGHIMVDRSDRKSQLRTLKQGIGYLKDGIHLCTFPEGTRSRTGRLLKFKNGAFKMAYKAGAPVIPISIVNSHKVMPTGWMMAMRPAHGLAEVIVHDPVESVGRTEEELAQVVRDSMIRGLPDDQVPL